MRLKDWGFKMKAGSLFFGYEPARNGTAQSEPAVTAPKEK
jgi:hypothetical protein